ncbi:hypothetical protein [Amycolatopsis sp. DG1A-15b]|uniref:hypothetical protein n=1 Tax=Amycolatopsis sp. DG1A-15b TaxID=3052846 RepID=UPI00255B588A|nr:hypothetical protein [Amycolatopsis sp. DG1A-15b]WIX85798.1 hypothetical protein QRY02_31925 [Amycolatopsis sp. DG1A-15b]
MTKGPHSEVTPAQYFWEPIRSIWVERGCLPNVPSLSRATRDIDRRIRKECGISGNDSCFVPKKTIYDWLRYTPTFPLEWIKVAALLEALGEDPADWECHYKKSNLLRSQSSSMSSIFLSARSTDSCEESSAIDSPESAHCQTRGIAEISAVPPLELPADAIATMIVVLPHAGVYRSPGDAEFLAVKPLGALITLPIEVPPFEGPDGRCYRMVRTPTRTSTGYAYMLNEALGRLN